MNAFDRLPDAAAEIFGAQATAEQAYGLLTVDVPAEEWIAALRTARTTLGCTFFDWLSAVDEPGTGLRVSAHLVALPDADDPAVRRLLVRTTVPHEAAALPTATNVFVIAQQYEVWVQRASASVLITTCLSVVTVTGLLYMIRSGALPADLFP